jgi:hypothetical protein
MDRFECPSKEVWTAREAWIDKELEAHLFPVRLLGIMTSLFWLRI